MSVQSIETARLDNLTWFTYELCSFRVNQSNPLELWPIQCWLFSLFWLNWILKDHIWHVLLFGCITWYFRVYFVTSEYHAYFRCKEEERDPHWFSCADDWPNFISSFISDVTGSLRFHSGSSVHDASQWRKGKTRRIKEWSIKWEGGNVAHTNHTEVSPECPFACVLFFLVFLQSVHLQGKQSFLILFVIDP